jgi:hypothetical protein
MLFLAAGFVDDGAKKIGIEILDRCSFNIHSARSLFGVSPARLLPRFC